MITAVIMGLQGSTDNSHCLQILGNLTGGGIISYLPGIDYRPIRRITPVPIKAAL